MKPEIRMSYQKLEAAASQSLISPTGQSLNMFMKNLSEVQILALIKTRKREGFDTLYENYAKIFYRSIYKIVGDAAMSEDIMQQVFVKIWRTIDQYDDSKGRLYTWMLHITHHTATDYLYSKDHKKPAKTNSNEEATGDMSSQAPRQAK